MLWDCCLLEPVISKGDVIDSNASCIVRCEIILEDILAGLVLVKGEGGLCELGIRLIIRLNKRNVTKFGFVGESCRL